MGLRCGSYSACHWTPSAKPGAIGDPDRLDGAVLRHTLDDDPLAGLKDALAVKRVDADGLAAEQHSQRLHRERD